MENSSTTWSLISIIDIVLCGLIVSRSDYGKDILAKIEGFKNFIEVAEKERLEALLEDDPYYFYNTLPFAQVLGVTKKWIDKFDKISKLCCFHEGFMIIFAMQCIKLIEGG